MATVRRGRPPEAPESEVEDFERKDCQKGNSCSLSLIKAFAGRPLSNYSN